MHGEKIPLRAQDFFQKSCARKRSIKASRRDQIIISALTPEHRPRPGNRGGGSDQRERGEGIQLPRAEEEPERTRHRTNSGATQQPHATPARAHRAPGRGHSRRKAGGAGDSRAASEAPPGSQNPQRHRRRAGRGAQRSEHRKPKSP